MSDEDDDEETNEGTLQKRKAFPQVGDIVKLICTVNSVQKTFYGQVRQKFLVVFNED